VPNEKELEAAVGFTNELEIRLISIRRSGTHALANWIVQQAEPPCLFVNNVDPVGGLKGRAKGDPFHGHERRRLEKRNLLVYSHEIYTIHSICSEQFEQQHDELVGTSRRRVDLLLMRDIFNLVASNRKNRTWKDKLLKPIWIEHALCWLGRLDYSTSQQLVRVSYNRWVEDASYRQSLAEVLGLDFTDKGREEVKRRTPYGWSNAWPGSSFDGVKFDGKASEMRTETRWREFAKDRGFWPIFTEDVVDLSNEIFDPIPGVEKYIGSKQE
jgi:hypothetical protein